MDSASIEMNDNSKIIEENGTLIDELSKNSANISWHRISVSTKPRKKFCRRIAGSEKILNSISGNVDSGQLLAVMGPSGAGKSTLLNVLTGRNLEDYNFEGKVLINGRESKISTVKSLSGYVQQGDLFIPMLTVREYLIFQSLVRMDNKYSLAQRSIRIDQVITELGLTKCVNARIGNRYDDIVGSGISGGELRRLAFAAEILTNPSILFCDEPTSGLDSYLAENVVRILKNLAKSGRTIICTIHQPSSDVFHLFDRILLLTEGRLAFMGSLNQANEFFTSLGFISPVNYNPADYYLKQISMIPEKEEECRSKIDKICNSFDNLSQSESNLSEISLQNGSSTDLFVAHKTSTNVYKASWCEQFKALLWRSYISNIREPMITRIKLSQTLTVALLLGIVYWNQQLNQKGIMNINGAIFILTINLTFMNVFSVINTFCSELPIFVREHNNGMYRVDTYFLSKMAAELPIQILMPTIFVAILYYMIGFNSSLNAYAKFIFVCNLVANCGMSFGYMISCISSSTKIAIALSSPLILPLLLFGGFFINNNSIPTYFKLFKYISWFYYGNEALVITQWRDIESISCDVSPSNSSLNYIAIAPNENRCLSKGLSVIEELSFKPDNILVDIMALLGLIVGMRLLAFFALFQSSKKR